MRLCCKCRLLKEHTKIQTVNIKGKTYSYIYCRDCKPTYFVTTSTIQERIYRWMSKYPEKVKAHRELNKALASGKIVRQTHCSQCPNSPAQAHHPDYSQPLYIVWLCKKCHVDADKERRLHEQATANKR